jgi:hypothetical protein
MKKNNRSDQFDLPLRTWLTELRKHDLLMTATDGFQAEVSGHGRHISFRFANGLYFNCPNGLTFGDAIEIIALNLDVVLPTDANWYVIRPVVDNQAS